MLIHPWIINSRVFGSNSILSVDLTKVGEADVVQGGESRGSESGELVEDESTVAASLGH